MKPYKVLFPNVTLAKRFEKTLAKISSAKTREKIMDDVEDLANQPRPYGAKKIKPPVEVYNYTAQHRLRIGSYRVLYDVDDKKRKVYIFALRLRNDQTCK